MGKGTKAEAGRSGQGHVLHWQAIYIGFEGDEYLPEREREGQVKSSRRAIEDAFTPEALARWADGEWKVARVLDGEEHLASLARLLTEELNAGAQPGFKWRFIVQPEEPVVRVLRTSNDPISPPPDIKPDGTICTYRNGRWIDEVEFPAWLEGEGTAEDPPADAAARRRGGGGRRHRWMPDGRHALMVRLVYDCPYEMQNRPPR